MPKFNVRASITISLSQTVISANEEAALEAADELGVPDLCFSCSTSAGDPSLWVIGELDGEPTNIEVEDD